MRLLRAASSRPRARFRGARGSVRVPITPSPAESPLPRPRSGGPIIPRSSVCNRNELNWGSPLFNKAAVGPSSSCGPPGIVPRLTSLATVRLTPAWRSSVISLQCYCTVRLNSPAPLQRTSECSAVLHTRVR